MAQTIQDFVNDVTGRLGNRANGVIGTQTMAESILSSVNNAIMKITRAYRLPIFERTFTIAVTENINTYALPTIDSNNINIEFRTISSVIFQDTSSNRWVLPRLSDSRRDAYFTENTSTGSPIFYTVFAGSIELYPVPSIAGTLHLRSDIWPQPVTSMTEYSPLGYQWDDAIVEYCTGECFAKLQQTLDANLWYTQFSKTCKSIRYALTEEPDWLPSVPGVDRGSGVVADPVNNAFIRRY